MEKSNLDPISNFFQLECINGQKILKLIDLNFSELSKVLRGLSLPTNHIQEISTSLLRGETPNLWLDMWKSSQVIEEYLKAVTSRYFALIDAMKLYGIGTLLDSPISLKIFYYPNTFFNALRQHTSRILKCPMDSLKLVSTWGKSQQESPVRITVQGIWIQGCRFDGIKLREAQTSDTILGKVPNFELEWMPEQNFKLYNPLELPLYNNSSRDYIITHLIVPAEVKIRNLAILAGAAFFLD